MVGVHDGMPAPAREQVPIHRKCGDEGDRQSEGEAAPEEEAREARLHRAGNSEDDRVVHDLHDGDRERVRGEREPDRGPEHDSAPKERHHRERVSEQERERDREGYGGPVAPAERGTDDQAKDLSDGTAGEAVRRRGEGEPVQARGVHGRQYTPTGYLVKWTRSSPSPLPFSPCVWPGSSRAGTGRAARRSSLRGPRRSSRTRSRRRRSPGERRPAGTTPPSGSTTSSGDWSPCSGTVWARSPSSPWRSSRSAGVLSGTRSSSREWRWPRQGAA